MAMNNADMERNHQELMRALRRRRFETRTGAIHQRRNRKDRRADAVNSNTKRGSAWRREI